MRVDGANLERDPGLRACSRDAFLVMPGRQRERRPLRAALRPALELASRGHPDLVLLGDPSALEAFIGVPVIVIGGPESDAVDRVRAFARGCDDFVARPFVYDELLARMHAVLRRAKPAEPERLRAGPISVERATRRVSVGGTRVDLAGKEYELLLKLASEPHRVFTKEELLRLAVVAHLERTRDDEQAESSSRAAGSKRCLRSTFVSTCVYATRRARGAARLGR